MEHDVKTMYQYWIGIDGGGSGTRACLARAGGAELGRGGAGPSGLMHGAEYAWAAILAAVDCAFGAAGLARPALGEMALGLGLAGVHNKQWATAFAHRNPGFGAIALETDAFVTLLGAHQGQPGAIIALGTGSVGEALLADGTRREVGGWGFPSGDEAGGAWLGLRAINHVQQVLDGRAPGTDFARALVDFCGGGRDSVFAWLAQANQTTYAQLAPLVVAHASRDQVAHGLLQEAGREVAKIAAALDPAQQLPIALCGGLAPPLRAYLPEQLLTRVVPAHADAATGALRLIRQSQERKQLC